MPNETEFYLGFPQLIGDYSDCLDSEKVWRLVLLLHDAMIKKLENACRQKHPSLSKKEIHKVASLSLLHWISSSPIKMSGDGFMLFLILKELVSGDLDIGEQLARNWIKQCSVSGAQAVSMKKLSEFSAMGERFVKSEGHNTKTKNFKERNMRISAEFQKLQTQGVHKTDVYKRLSVRHGITIRQLQRIVKENKNDI